MVDEFNVVEVKGMMPELGFEFRRTKYTHTYIYIYIYKLKLILKVDALIEQRNLQI
jgi:hypothetical protein